MLKNIFFSLLSVSLLASTTLHAATAADEISISDAYARAVPPVMRNNAVYLTLKNASKSNHLVLSAQSDVAEVVELHNHEMNNGVMQMRKMAHVHAFAESIVEFKPSAQHVMLLGLKRPLNSGDTFEVTFTFQDASTDSFNVVVR